MRRAFVVGTGIYDDDGVSDLAFATKDAEEIYKVLMDPSIGAAAESSKLLTNPTRAQLVDELGRFLRTLSEGDEFVLYFAGHASRSRAGRWSLYCRNTVRDDLSLTSFSFDDLRALLRQYDRSRGILVVDTCFARSVDALLELAGARGRIDEILPPTPREGLAIVWSCGSEDLSFEEDGHGLFTGLLLAGLRCGADLGPGAEFVRPADLVDWIRGRLEDSLLEDRLWPGCRIAGDVATLHFARNPEFDPGHEQASATGSHVELTRRLNQLLRQAGLDDSTLDFELRYLRRAGSDFDHASELARAPGGDVRVVPAAASGELWNWIKGPAGWSFCFGLVVTALTGSAGWGGTVLGVSLGGSLLYSARRCWMLLKHRKDWYVVVTSYGFYESAPGRGGERRHLAVPWSCVAHIDHPIETRNGVVTRNEVIVTLSSPLDEIRPSLTDPSRKEWDRGHLGGKGGHGQVVWDNRNCVYEGGLDRLERDLKWGRDLRRNRLVMLASDDSGDGGGQPSSARFLLAGVNAYTNLSTLKAPETDVRRVQSWIAEQQSRSRIDVSLGADLASFEAAISTLFAAARSRIVVVYFAGHGVVSAGELYLALRTTERDRLHETAFPTRRFVDLAKEKQVRHVVLILDCCYSAAGAGGLGLTLDSAIDLGALFDSENDTVTVLAAAGAEEEAFESRTSGVFTRHLLEAASAVLGTKGRVTLNDRNIELSRRLGASGLPQWNRFFASDLGRALEILSLEQKSASIQKLSQELEQVSAREREQLENWTRRFQREGIVPEEILYDPLVRPVRSCLEILVRNSLWLAAGAYVAYKGGEHFTGGAHGSAVGCFLFAALFLAIAVGNFARNRSGPRFLLFTEAGVIRSGRRRFEVLPAATILRVRAPTETSEHGTVTETTTVYLVLRDGREIEIAKSDDLWREPIESIAAIAQASVEYYGSAYEKRGRTWLRERLSGISSTDDP